MIVRITYSETLTWTKDVDVPQEELDRIEKIWSGEDSTLSTEDYLASEQEMRTRYLNDVVPTVQIHGVVIEDNL